MTKPGLPLIERMMLHVEFDPNGGCWLWNASLSPSGYGKITVGGRQMGAHRKMLEETMGAPLPDGINALHVCDVRPCIRPDHLFPGTQADNVHDMIRKGRRPKIGQSGEANGNARITSFLAADMREALKTTDRAAVARNFGVSWSTANRVFTGESWAE